jgi:hypothetical protein
MDPVAVSIVTILGKYALEKGLELGKKATPGSVKR